MTSYKQNTITTTYTSKHTQQTNDKHKTQNTSHTRQSHAKVNKQKSNTNTSKNKLVTIRADQTPQTMKAIKQINKTTTTQPAHDKAITQDKDRQTKNRSDTQKTNTTTTQANTQERHTTNKDNKTKHKNQINNHKA